MSAPNNAAADITDQLRALVERPQGFSVHDPAHYRWTS